MYEECNVEVTVISSYRGRQGRLYGELSRDSFSESCSVRVYKCNGKASFLGRTARGEFSLIFVSVCVRGRGKVSATRGLEGFSGSYLLIFAAASASRTLRNFEIQTLRCLIGPCDSRRLSVLLSRVSRGVSVRRGCVRVPSTDSSLHVGLYSVLCTRRFGRYVRVRYASGSRGSIHDAFTRFMVLFSSKSGFFIYGQKVVMGLRRVGSVGNGRFILSGNRGVSVDQDLMGDTGDAFNRCVFNEESLR